MSGKSGILWLGLPLVFVSVCDTLSCPLLPEPESTSSHFAISISISFELRMAQRLGSRSPSQRFPMRTRRSLVT